MANLEFTIEGNQISVVLGNGTGIVSVGFKRDKFDTDGVTESFELTYIPLTESIMVFWNGVLQEYGVDYTISGKTLTPASVLEDGKLEAVYARGQQVVYDGLAFKYDKFAGTGAQTLFALSFTRRANTLAVFVDGIMKELNVDYTETGSGASITFSTAPYSGAVIEARYVETD